MPEKKDILLVYTDGGSRGNPGPAAIGVLIGDKSYSQAIGQATNNVAEYRAVIFALQKIKQLLGKEKLKKTEVIVHLDSELVYSQLCGKYKILEPELQPLFIAVWNLKLDFAKLSFKKISRQDNKAADRLVNLALDQETKDNALF